MQPVVVGKAAEQADVERPGELEEAAAAELELGGQALRATWRWSCHQVPPEHGLAPAACGWQHAQQEMGDRASSCGCEGPGPAREVALNYWPKGPCHFPHTTSRSWAAAAACSGGGTRNAGPARLDLCMKQRGAADSIVGSFLSRTSCSLARALADQTCCWRRQRSRQLQRRPSLARAGCTRRPCLRRWQGTCR